MDVKDDDGIIITILRNRTLKNVEKTRLEYAVTDKSKGYPILDWIARNEEDVITSISLTFYTGSERHKQAFNEVTQMMIDGEDLESISEWAKAIQITSEEEQKASEEIKKHLRALIDLLATEIEK